MSSNDKQIDQLAAVITLMVANGLIADLGDNEKRTPQMYNAAVAFLKNLKFEVDPDSDTLKPPLGALADKLKDIPLPEQYN